MYMWVARDEKLSWCIFKVVARRLSEEMATWNQSRSLSCASFCGEHCVCDVVPYHSMRRASLLALSLAVATAEERPSCSRRKAHKEISHRLIRQWVTSRNNCFLRNDFAKKRLRASWYLSSVMTRKYNLSRHLIIDTL